MKIKRFVGKSLNGYLNFDMRFFDQLTFVTGINGSGKTSALNSIAALLLPRLDYLAGEYFEEISLEISHEDEEVRLTAKKNESATELSCTRYPDDKFLVVGIDEDESVPGRRARDYEEEYYNELRARYADNPILNYIESLPTPMYLGLDRRSFSFERDRSRLGPRVVGRARTSRNIFGRSLEAGLTEALHFARERIQVDRRREFHLDVYFRERLVLALIDFPPISFSGELDEPSAEELREFEETKRNLGRLADLLNIDREKIASKTDPVIEFLNTTLRKIRRRKSDSSEGEFALFEWSFNKTNIEKLRTLSEIISEYNDRANAIKRHTNEYLNTVNGFMHDSGKRIMFNSIGELRFVLENDESREERHINTLSSGEIQVVVILTHLYFNPEVERANVFIIDEPELSLHVQWQEKFVDGIIEASGETQFILATHSPTVILDRINSCIEISQS